MRNEKHVYDLTWKDKFLIEMDKIKSMKGKKKREYIWEYYKIHIIATAFFLIVAGSLFNDIVLNPPPDAALTVAWMGFEFDENLNIFRETIYPVVVEDPENETVQIITFFLGGGDPQMDMAMLTRFAAMTAAAELDIVIGDMVYHDEYGYTNLGLAPLNSFADVRPFLNEAGISLDTDDLIFYEEDGEPIAVGVPLSAVPIFNEIDFFPMERYLGVVVNTRRREEVVEVMRYLWDVNGTS